MVPEGDPAFPLRSSCFFTSRSSLALLPCVCLKGGCGMALPRLLVRALHRAAAAAAPAAPGEEERWSHPLLIWVPFTPGHRSG